MPLLLPEETPPLLLPDVLPPPLPPLDDPLMPLDEPPLEPLLEEPPSPSFCCIWFVPWGEATLPPHAYADAARTSGEESRAMCERERFIQESPAWGRDNTVQGRWAEFDPASACAAA
jgi:hypothetical protein